MTSVNRNKSAEGPYTFPFPLPIEDLQTDCVKLTPFIISQHGKYYADGITDPTVLQYLPFDMATVPEITKFLAMFRQDNSTNILFAIIDKTKPSPVEQPMLGGAVAGIIGLIHVSAFNLSTEIGPVVVLPAFQRTHVSTHSIGILLRYTLNQPNKGGLGFRRVQWTAHPGNTTSIRVAEKMGMRIEGTMRWTWVVGANKVGQPARKEDSADKLGRGSVLLAICWDDWEDGGSEKVDQLIARV